MKVNIQAVNFNVDRKLVDFINERLTKLEKYYDKIVTFDVFLKLDNGSDKENKCVDVKILVPGDELIVKKVAKTFEEAVDLCGDSLERLLLKRKERIKSHL
ncbi:ribosome hibernation-promoting factor, HPF/YfiA family [Flavobacterium sp. NKUCC04_CG]|uniref:ribosome hibernation-promoting factor, HPF/YfiA family n=1 Tax=Flavobacterium sp. NKUCC04_CG TaxID=2842121 RepID=UPI001C5B379F|nr:ribosome-associated translation inhibitor RaiA [Flavobacterium sp. NKUCC04_CG]MBW3517709.1 ribosome-associated translation inhibitor RaiA [Flavobacterium sp. NKUCC04_CG]